MRSGGQAGAREVCFKALPGGHGGKRGRRGGGARGTRKQVLLVQGFFNAPESFPPVPAERAAVAGKVAAVPIVKSMLEVVRLEVLKLLACTVGGLERVRKVPSLLNAVPPVLVAYPLK